MGALFSRMRSRLSLSNLTTTPAPATIRKYGLKFILIFGLPKFMYDMYQLRRAQLSESKEDEDEKKDPAIRVLRLTTTKALIDLQRLWDRVILNHCYKYGKIVEPLWQDVQREALQTTTDLALHDAEFEKDSTKTEDQAQDDDGEEDSILSEDNEAEDGFLKQWLETIGQVILNPLMTALNIEEDDPNMEQSIRASIKILSSLTSMCVTVIQSQRRENALQAFLGARNMHIKDGVKDKKDLNYVAHIQDKLTFNLARSKKKLISLYTKRGSKNDAYHYMLDPNTFDKALQAIWNGNTEKKGPSKQPRPSYEHWRLWNDSDSRRTVDTFMDEQYPVQYHDRLSNREYMQLCCKARMLDITCDHELGSIRKQRFYKLLHFINTELCGGWRERFLIVVSWVLGSAKSLITAIDWHYRSTLLIESIESTLLRRRATGGGVFLSKVLPTSGALISVPLKLTDVCLSIFILKALQTLISDATKRVEEVGFGAIRRGLQKKVTHHVLSQDLIDIDENDESSRLISSLADNDEWSAGLGRVLLIPSECIDSFTTIITTLFLLWGKSPRLLLLCVAADVCTTRLNNRFYSIVRWLNGLFGLDKTTWKGWIEMRSVEQALSNFEDMRINAKEYDIEKSVVKASEISERDDLRSSVVGNMMAPFRDMLNDVPTLVTAFFGGTFALAGSISAADLTNFTFQISSLVNKATRFRGELESLWKMEDHRFTYGLSLMDLLDQKPKMGIDGGWKPTNTNDGLHGDIEFKNVSFRYKGMPKNMLKNISYTIPEGSFVGICGERGAGKSTMYKLIMRLYDPNEGEILIGGHPLEYYNSVWLRSNIGISVQKPAIMRYKSLKENVIYGSESKFRKLGMGPIEIEKHIQHVLEKANIWEHFQDKEKFPQGLATKCYNLSGGETRSVGTARALLKDPSILLLDEPTEGLDAENEEKVMKNIVGDRRKGQTVLTIAHRLSSVKNADLIIFVGKDGTIQELGTWNDLLELENGKFANAVRIQNLEGHTGGHSNGGDGGRMPTSDAPSVSASTLSDAHNVEGQWEALHALSALVEEEEQEEQEKKNALFLTPEATFEEAMHAVEKLRLYSRKSKNISSSLLFNLDKACEQVVDQHRMQTRMLEWSPFHDLKSASLRRTSIRQKEQGVLLRQLSGGGGGGGSQARGGNGRGGGNSNSMQSSNAALRISKHLLSRVRSSPSAMAMSTVADKKNKISLRVRTVF